MVAPLALIDYHTPLQSYTIFFLWKERNSGVKPTSDICTNAPIDAFIFFNPTSFSSITQGLKTTMNRLILNRI